MKLLRTLTPFLVLGMAFCVTVGSIYVTVEAAAQQQQDGDDTGTAEAVTPPAGEAVVNPFEAVNEPAAVAADEPAAADEAAGAANGVAPVAVEDVPLQKLQKLLQFQSKPLVLLTFLILILLVSLSLREFLSFHD